MTSGTPSSVSREPGWYPIDRGRERLWRYWDGKVWTTKVAGPTQVAQESRRGRSGCLMGALLAGESAPGSVLAEAADSLPLDDRT